MFWHWVTKAKKKKKKIQETNEIKNTYNNKFEFWFIE